VSHGGHNLFSGNSLLLSVSHNDVHHVSLGLRPPRSRSTRS
jgi:hypothetical protein